MAAIDYWGTSERHGGLPFIRPAVSHSAMSWAAMSAQEKGDLCRKTEGEVDAWRKDRREGDPIKPPRCTVRKYFEQQGLSGTDMLLYTKIPYMINNGVNIVYETTFQNKDTIEFICKQIVQQTDNCKSFQYIIMLGFPIVNIGKLQQRIWDREKKSFCLSCPEQCPPDAADGERERDHCNRGLQGIQFTDLSASMTESYTNLKDIIYQCARTKQDGRGGAWGCKGVGIDLLYIYDNNDEGRLVSAIRLSRRSYKIISGNKHTAHPIGPKNFASVLAKIDECLSCIRAVSESYGLLLKRCESNKNRGDDDPCKKNPLANFNTLSEPINAEAGPEDEKEARGREASPDPNAFADSQDSIYGEEDEEDAATDIQRVYSRFAARKKKKTAETNPGGGGGRRTRKYRKKSKRRTRRR